MGAEELARLVEGTVARLVSGFGNVTFTVQDGRVVSTRAERSFQGVASAIQEVAAVK